MARNKYRVAPKDQRTWRGKTYASKAEMLYAQIIEFMANAGEVIEVIEQPRIWLGVPENVYVPDFLVIPAKREQPYYVDVKGVETKRFKQIKKLWAAYGRLDLRIVKRKGNGFSTVEVIKGNKID